MKTYKSSSLMPFRLFSLVLTIQFVAFQSLVYGASEIQSQTDLSTQPAISVDDFQASNTANLPNPNDLNTPALTPYSFTPISGSVTINDGSFYTNQQNVTLHFQVSGGEMPADGNNNGAVDAADYVIWRDRFGQTGFGIQGDYDRDNDVDGNDYLVWQQNFGKTDGVAQMAFSTDGTNFSAWETYQSTRLWNFSGPDGYKFIYIKFRDSLNNESSVMGASVYLDMSGPVGGSFSIQPSGGGTNNHTLTPAINLVASVNDFGSGVQTFHISEDGGNTWSDWRQFPGSIIPYTILDQTNGTKTISIQYRDTALNISDTYSNTVILDTIPPVFSIQNGALFKTKQGVQKVIIMGPEFDQENDKLQYSFQSASQNLLDNGQFSLIAGADTSSRQLTYKPNDSFVGSGQVTIRASDYSSGEFSEITINLEVKAPTFDYSNDPQSTYQLDKVNGVRAWNLSRGTGVKIAVIDTGFDMDHPDLDGNYIDPKDYSDGDTNPSPSGVPGSEHGTHVAGIAAAKNNGTGVSGIAPEAKIVPIRAEVISQQGLSAISPSYAIQGIYHAISVGAKVINMSFGGPISLFTAAFQEAINAAHQAGIVIVAAAGNDNVDTSTAGPAALSNVISVSATDSSDARYTQSNFWADISAPGVGIRSTVPNDTYANLTGTSMASPMVAGLAALMFAQDPDATPDNIYMRMKLSAIDLGTSGRDQYFGDGRIDAFKALSYDYWDNGRIKTQWLEEPDENGYVKLNFDAAGVFLSGETAGLGALSGFGASLTNAFMTSITNSEENISKVEHFPGLFVPLTVSSHAAQKTPLFWSAVESHVKDVKTSDSETNNLRPFNSKLKKLPRR